MVKLSAKFEDVKIPLGEPVHELEAVSGVLGVPEWWPTGSRVGVVLAHGTASSISDSLIQRVHGRLTEAGYLTLSFNFPFAERKKKRPDPMPVLERVFRSAIAYLGRDPAAAPTHLLLGGQGLGGRAATYVAVDRVRIEGLFFLAYALHKQGQPETARVENLYRIISPMLFVQGDRDRSCELDVLRQALGRVGAPVTLHVVQEADSRFRAPKKSPRTTEELCEEVVASVETWIAKTLES